MKGILSAKNFSKYLPSKNTSNMGKTLNKLNYSSFHSEEKTEPNAKQTSKGRYFFENLIVNNISKLENVFKKTQYNLSSLSYNYYYRFQNINLNNYMRDLAVLKFSDDKNNLSGNNKNLNEEEVGFKLNDSPKGNNNSNGKKI